MTVYHLKSTSIVKDSNGNHAGTWVSDKHTILFVHAKWCGYCKRTMPEFMEAAKMSSAVNFALVEDVVLKEMSQPLSVRGFPTFFLIDKDTGMVKEVNFPRERNEMIAFINKL